MERNRRLVLTGKPDFLLALSRTHPALARAGMSPASMWARVCGSGMGPGSGQSASAEG